MRIIFELKEVPGAGVAFDVKAEGFEAATPLERRFALATRKHLVDGGLKNLGALAGGEVTIVTQGKPQNQ